MNRSPQIYIEQHIYDSFPSTADYLEEQWLQSNFIENNSMAVFQNQNLHASDNH